MPAATRIAIFFATESGVLRRKIIPDDDSQLDRLCGEPGESVLTLPLIGPYDDASCRDAIAAAIGRPPASGRCCIIDGDGNVVGLCYADPALDSHPCGRLVASEKAQLGDRYDGGVFLRRPRAAAAPGDTNAWAARLPPSESSG